MHFIELTNAHGKRKRLTLNADRISAILSHERDKNTIITMADSINSCYTVKESLEEILEKL